MWKKFVFLLLFVYTINIVNAQYNNLWIPDTLSGKNFNLVIKDTFAQFKTGNQTITGAVNNNKFWGSTLIFQKGDTVHMNVKNTLNDSTTIHWHGAHLPAVMDGGPHQIIPPGTTWQPYWKVTNNAATYWYHPHLHDMTMAHITKGIGGFIIVRDTIESKLALPRTYGVDDIPLAVTSRSFTSANVFTITDGKTISEYGDTLLTNGVTRAQISLPKQYVRFRILNAEIERGYNLGFSDGRTFYVIANDGGLLDTPVAVTRVKLLVGERVEILVNLGNDVVGGTVDLKSFNSGLAFGFPGAEPNKSGLNGSYLNNADFSILHIVVKAATSNAITALPTKLTTNTYWTAANATVQRNLTVTAGSGVGISEFYFDNTAFNYNTINKTVNLNAIEQWTITNSQVFSHAFHIHDVQFKIVSRTSGVQNYESGWKDVVYLPKGETVSFVAKFEDFADSVHPYMYHCHFSNHEDGGMMGQFVVKSTSSLPLNLLSFTAQLDQSETYLKWITSKEINTSQFEIERSTNNIVWTSLGSVNALDKEVNNYSFVDLNPKFGINYYRIKFIDTDGKYNYSNIQTVENGSDAFQFSIYPNPAQNKIYLQFKDPAYEVYYIKLTNEIGRVIYMLPKPQLGDGLDVSKLAKGVYYLQVTDNKTMKTFTKKFIKE